MSFLGETFFKKHILLQAGLDNVCRDFPDARGGRAVLFKQQAGITTHWSLRFKQTLGVFGVFDSLGFRVFGGRVQQLPSEDLAPLGLIRQGEN